MKPMAELVRESRGRAENPARTRWLQEQIQQRCADQLAAWLDSVGVQVPNRFAWEHQERMARLEAMR